MNEKLQKALVTSLVRKSLLLSDRHKHTLLSALPTMTIAQMTALQRLVGSEEAIVNHPRDLNLEEIIETANDMELDELERVISQAEEDLRQAEHVLSDANDQAHIDSIRTQLLS